MVGVGRGGRHHRRPVDRRAGHPAHDADVPHRRRRRPRHHRRPAARRGAVRGPRPQGQGRDQPHRRRRRDPPERHRDEGQGREHRGLRHLAGRAQGRRDAGRPRRPRRGQPGHRPREGSKDKERDTSTDVVGPRPRLPRQGSANGLIVRAEDVVEREYTIPHNAKILVENGQEIRAGDAITDGPINPQEYLDTRGKDAVQRYLVKEVQKVYKSQGVTINDKHIEIIVRQMLRKVRIDQPGDVDLLPTELIDRLEFEEANNRVLAEGGEPATAQTVLLGVTKASLNTSSFLAAASFQETTRVLTEAAINGAKDHLIGLKENVIIGKLIPAGTGAPANVAARKERDRRAALEALAGEALDGGASEYNPFLEDGRRPADDEAAGPRPGGDDRGASGRRRATRRRRAERRRVQPVPRRGRGGREGCGRRGRRRGPPRLPASRRKRAPGRSNSGVSRPREGSASARAPRPATPVTHGGPGRPPAGVSGDVRPRAVRATARTNLKGAACSLLRISQLVRHGRQRKIMQDQGVGDAQELEQPAAAPVTIRAPRRSAGLPAGSTMTPRSRTRRFARSPAPLTQPDGGHGLHPGPRPQPPDTRLSLVFGPLRHSALKWPRGGAPRSACAPASPRSPSTKTT